MGISKVGNKYRVRVTVDGVRISAGYYDTKREALIVQHDLLEDINKKGKFKRFVTSIIRRQR